MWKKEADGPQSCLVVAEGHGADSYAQRGFRSIPHVAFDTCPQLDYAALCQAVRARARKSTTQRLLNSLRSGQDVP